LKFQGIGSKAGRDLSRVAPAEILGQRRHKPLTKFGPNYNIKPGSKSLYPSGPNSHTKIGPNSHTKIGNDSHPKIGNNVGVLDGDSWISASGK